MGSEGEAQQALLEHGLLQNRNDDQYTGDGSTDIHGKSVLRSKTGSWRACPYILATECCERLAYYSITANLVTYITKKLHEGNVKAARIIMTWQGACYLTPLMGAFLADACWGRYWTIAVFSTLYLAGMSTLTLHASIPAFKPADCEGSLCPSATPAQNGIFLLGLYLTAVGTGGIKPCVSAFGADQFDDTNPNESAKKASFFNWFFFCISFGSFLATTLVVWLQENKGWGLGYGVSTLLLGIAIICFFSGTPLYRHRKPRGSALTGLVQVLVASLRKRKLEVPEDCFLLYETLDNHRSLEGNKKLEHTEGLRWLDKAAIVTDENLSSPWRLCTVTQVEELKIIVRMFPIWVTGIVFFSIYTQSGTMFVEQGLLMNRTFGSFTIPAASMSTFSNGSMILVVLIYDRILVPVARKFTGRDRGFSELQRSGIGLFFSIMTMVSAAVVEMKRLQLAKELNLVHENAAIPLSIFWQVPQHMLMAIAEIFTFIGLLEFFYNQAPDGMRSLCNALYLLSISIGSYLGSLVLTIVTAITTRGGKPGWIPDNLNTGHLDYYFLLWAALSFFNMLLYYLCAMRYKQKAL